MMKRIGLESRLRKGILPVAAFFVALGTANVSKAGVTDGIFNSSFEQLPVENISGMEEGFESDRTVYADVCPIAGKQITDVTFIYNTTGGGVLRNKGTTAGVAMVPVSSKNNLESFIKTSKGSSSCIPYVVEQDIPLTYDTTLEPEGTVDWKIRVNYDDASFHETPVESTMLYANEDTAQIAIEEMLNNDSNAFVDCYDCDFNGIQYDSLGFFLDNGLNFAIEYNGENRSSSEIQLMRENYETLSSKRFFELNLSSLEELVNQISDISQNHPL